MEEGINRHAARERKGGAGRDPPARGRGGTPVTSIRPLHGKHLEVSRPFWSHGPGAVHTQERFQG